MSETRVMSAEQAAGAGGWRASTAVARGAVHEAAGLPLQDAAGCAGTSGRVVLAVADGHGGRPHFRSARGAELAIEAGLSTAAEIWPRLATGAAAAGLRPATAAALAPALVSRWRQAVAADLRVRPLAAGERALMRPGGSAWVPYGSTLLLALLAPPWLAMWQIGDGDIVAVHPGGAATLPVPGDPLLDGQRTTSLCQPDAPAAFRVGVTDLRHTPVAALLLATDGFGNAQTADPWHQPFAADLLRLARDHGTGWVHRQLPAWVARCASAEGSGDDAAAALLLRQDPPLRHGPRPEGSGA